MPSAVTTGWLTGTLLLCKSRGSFVYAMALAPAILLMRPRSQMRLSGVLVSLALTYPMLRTANLFPSDLMLDAAGLVSVEREAPLK